MDSPTDLCLSGERFRARYRLAGNLVEARASAEALCIEQTVEFPRELLPPGPIPEQVVGRTEALEPLPGENACSAVLSFAVETAGSELPQLLNVLFGNASLLPGVRLEALELSPGLLGRYRGPRFGIPGLRGRLEAARRPLLATALKPMGLSAAQLAGMAYELAQGGMDLVKDDHGLADQPLSRFRERVERASAAVARANAETGGRTLYAPNISAPAGEVAERAHFARGCGAGALLVAPGLVGWDAVRALADDDALALPLLGHPALQGSFVLSPDHGISPSALFGQLYRLAGLDACIFPSYGGRFSFSQADCRAICDGCQQVMGGLRPIFPVPAGGMRLERVPELLEFYGSEVVFLIGGDLHRGGDLVASCRRFRREASAD